MPDSIRFVMLLLAMVGFAAEAQAQTCSCKEYICLNEPDISSVIKFEVGSSILLTPEIGINGGAPPNKHFNPGKGVSELPAPHGLTTDLNGNSYIGGDFSQDFLCPIV